MKECYPPEVVDQTCREIQQDFREICLILHVQHSPQSSLWTLLRYQHTFLTRRDLQVRVDDQICWIEQGQPCIYCTFTLSSLTAFDDAKPFEQRPYFSVLLLITQLQHLETTMAYVTPLWKIP